MFRTCAKVTRNRLTSAWKHVYLHYTKEINKLIKSKKEIKYNKHNLYSIILNYAFFLLKPKTAQMNGLMGNLRLPQCH